jgi:aminoglycoside phosphotransferase (APT) family kinase protein
VNLEQATHVLRDHLGQAVEALAVQRGPVGNSQETWFVTARDGGGERELVLRRSATGGALEATDRGWEGRVLGALSESGLPVPTVYGSGVLDRPYLLMERRPGVLVGWLDKAEQAALARELGGLLARLHALDPQDLGFESSGSREATLVEVQRWRDLYSERRVAPVPLLGALFAWLETNVPDEAVASVLLWGDAGPHNILVSEGRVTALLDWELAHIGHPLEDVGAAVWACLGRLDEDELVAGYEEQIGSRVDRATLDYFVAMACATRSAMLVNGVEAWIGGRASAPATAGLGLDLLALNLARGAAAAGWGELPPSDGQAPELPFRPSPAESVSGVARWLVAEVLPVADGDARLKRMVRAAAALLDSTALRIPSAPTRDLGAVEAQAVEAELGGGNVTIRATLLADLAREWTRLSPLTDLHGHLRPAP